MSTDYYLWSRSHKKSAQIGSVGFSGVQSYPGEAEVVAFVRWAIDNNVTDIVMTDEHHIDAADGWEDAP